MVYRNIHNTPPEDLITLTDMAGEPICSMTKDHASWMIVQGYLESDDDHWNLTDSGRAYLIVLRKSAEN